MAVLLVDDDRALLEVLRRSLTQPEAGGLGPEVEVLVASTGAEALALATSRARSGGSIDVLVTDQKMPGMSGLELVKKLRGELREELRRRSASSLAPLAPQAMQAILLTAYTEPRDLLQAINEGQVFRYLVKPWERVELIATIRQALATAAVHRERDVLHARLERRLHTMTALVELSASGAAGQAYGQTTTLQSQRQLLARVDQALRQIMPFDAAAVLLAPPPGPGQRARPSMLLTSRDGDRIGRGSALADAVLAARDACLRRYNEAYDKAQGGAALELAEVTVQHALGFDASGAGPSRPPRVVELSAIVAQPGTPARVVGAVYVAAITDEAGPLRPDLFGSPFDDGDAQNLEALAAQVGDLSCRLAARIEDERRRMELMVASMADGVIMTDQTGEIFLINPAARRMLSLPPAEAAAPPVTSQFLKERLGFYPFELVRAGRGADGPLREEVRIGEQYLHSIISPVFSGPGSGPGSGHGSGHGSGSVGAPDDGSGELVGVVVVLRDITEQKALEVRKDEFVSIVSHELRTPLTSIGGALELLLEQYDEGLSEKQRRYVQMARESSQKLNRIVDDLLDVARVERGQLPLRTGAIDLGELCAQAAERFRGAAEQKHAELVVRVTGRSAGSVRLSADADRLTQVLSNLLSNAIKFTPEGGRIEIEAFASPATDELVGLSVWNSGPNIAEADRERVFDKFEQVQASNTRRVGGTGLGLAISRGIVERHSGQIWVEPSPSGARFVVVLPVHAHEAPQPASDLPTPLGPKQAVLVVEDEPHAAWLLKGALLGARYAVHLAADPETALAIARERRPELISCDLQMPGPSSGAELIEILRHDPETRKIPILVISAGADRAAVVGDAVLRKPVGLTHLRESVLTLLSEAGHLRRRVLIVDDDAAIRLICREVLEAHGFLVREAEDGPAALAEARRFRPDLVLVDVMMPEMDGFTLAQKLRGERETALVPLIFVSARGQTADKVRAFKLGAEDYMVKPFDSAELVARVEKALLRRDFDLGASPTTRLPGSQVIGQEIERRLHERGRFAFCYLDLDNLKAFNDYYGYAKADAVIRQTGDIVREVVARHGTTGDFIGHIAGDDFVLITTPDHADAVCGAVIDAFDRLVPLYYNKADRERGYIEARDRFGVMRQFPIMSVSIACVTDSSLRTQHELSTVAAELKQKAKAIVGSAYVRDGEVLVPSPRPQKTANEKTA